MTDDPPERMLERRALRIEQHSEMPLYLFALAADEVALVADVARISRDEAGKLIGYQRPERRNHVKQILEYLNSGEVLFPNGLILALPETVRFRSSRGPATTDGLATAGTLEIPLPATDDEPATGVDRRRSATQPRAGPHQKYSTGRTRRRLRRTIPRNATRPIPSGQYRRATAVESRH